eukprot:TRINITY_DN13495_c0_g1_i1.p1 TRINITY_DN13495_c0_g1~~TRINITY_DN13495_c0_g1_i1.p1  ORF type:complete len:1311 (-),score=200.88 TRINITY_DN13495_c0_g1_i1:116-4048(-)
MDPDVVALQSQPSPDDCSNASEVWTMPRVSEDACSNDGSGSVNSAEVPAAPMVAASPRLSCDVTDEAPEAKSPSESPSESESETEAPAAAHAREMPTAASCPEEGGAGALDDESMVEATVNGAPSVASAEGGVTPIDMSQDKDKLMALALTSLPLDDDGMRAATSSSTPLTQNDQDRALALALSSLPQRDDCSSWLPSKEQKPPGSATSNLQSDVDDSSTESESESSDSSSEPPFTANGSAVARQNWQPAVRRSSQAELQGKPGLDGDVGAGPPPAASQPPDHHAVAPAESAGTHIQQQPTGRLSQMPVRSLIAGASGRPGTSRSSPAAARRKDATTAAVPVVSKASAVDRERKPSTSGRQTAATPPPDVHSNRPTFAGDVAETKDPSRLVGGTRGTAALKQQSSQRPGASRSPSKERPKMAIAPKALPLTKGAPGAARLPATKSVERRPTSRDGQREHGSAAQDQIATKDTMKKPNTSLARGEGTVCKRSLLPDGKEHASRVAAGGAPTGKKPFSPEGRGPAMRCPTTEERPKQKPASPGALEKSRRPLSPGGTDDSQEPSPAIRALTSHARKSLEVMATGAEHSQPPRTQQLGRALRMPGSRVSPPADAPTPASASSAPAPNMTGAARKAGLPHRLPQRTQVTVQPSSPSRLSAPVSKSPARQRSTSSREARGRSSSPSDATPSSPGSPASFAGHSPPRPSREARPNRRSNLLTKFVDDVAASPPRPAARRQPSSEPPPKVQPGRARSSSPQRTAVVQAGQIRQSDVSRKARAVSPQRPPVQASREHAGSGAPRHNAPFVTPTRRRDSAPGLQARSSSAAAFGGPTAGGHLQDTKQRRAADEQGISSAPGCRPQRGVADPSEGELDSQSVMVAAPHEQAEARRGVERPSQRNAVAARFVEFLRQQRGSVLRAWRLDLDKTSQGWVTRANFAAACRSIGFGGEARQIWDSIRPDGNSAPVRFHELDACEADNLERFAQLLSLRSGGDLGKAWSILDRGNRTYVSLPEFGKCLRELGFLGNVPFIFKGLDTHGQGQLKRRDFDYLKLLSPSFMQLGRTAPAIHDLAAWARQEHGTVDALLEKLGFDLDDAAGEPEGIVAGDLAARLKALGFLGDALAAAVIAARSGGGSATHVTADTLRPLLTSGQKAAKLQPAPAPSGSAAAVPMQGGRPVLKSPVLLQPHPERAALPPRRTGWDSSLGTTDRANCERHADQRTYFSVPEKLPDQRMLKVCGSISPLSGSCPPTPASKNNVQTDDLGLGAPEALVAMAITAQSPLPTVAEDRMIHDAVTATFGGRSDGSMTSRVMPGEL